MFEGKQCVNEDSSTVSSHLTDSSAVVLPVSDRAIDLLVAVAFAVSFLPYFLSGGIVQYAFTVPLVGAIVGYQLLLGRLHIERSYAIVLPYAAWLLTSLIVVSYGDRGSVDSMMFVLGSLAILLTAALLAGWLVRHGSLVYHLHALAIAGGILALIPIGNAITTSVAIGRPVFQLTPKMVGSVGLSGLGSMLLVTSIAAVALSTAWRYRALAGFQFVGLVLVGGRAGIGALAVFCTVYAASYWSRRLCKTLVAGVVINFMLFVIGFLTLWLWGGTLFLDEPLVDILTGRPYLWIAGTRVLAAHSLFGVGLQNIAPALVAHLQSLGAPTWLIGKGAHNTFVRIAVGAGVPALLTLCVVFGRFYIAALRSTLHQRDQRFYLAAVTGLLVYGLFESLLFGGASIRSFSLTLFTLAGLGAFRD